MRTGMVNSITKLSTIRTGLDLMEVVIDNIAYRLFGDYTMYLKLIDATVIYDTRPDVIAGVEHEVITDVGERSLVRTKAYEENPSLLPDGSETHEVCNFALDSLGIGDRMNDVIVYLSSYEKGASDKAKWVDMKVVDIKSRVSNVRVFTGFGMREKEALDLLDQFVGNYIKCNIQVTKYGVQAQADEVEFVASPVAEPREVVAAIDIISRAVADDKDLKAYMEANLFIDRLKNLIDIEPGWHLVRIASEISMFIALKNITNAYSLPLLIRASITSRGYLLTKNPEKFSKPVLNVNQIQRSALKADMELITMVDVASKTTNPTKRAFISVANMINTIVEERRGLIDEEEIIAAIHSISRSFGGLL